MGNPVTSSQFIRLLDERLTSVAENETKNLQSMIPTFFNVKTSNSAWEEFFSVGDVPDIPEMNGKKSRLAIAPGFHVKIEHKEFGGYLEFERKLIDDKKYAVLDSRAAGLLKSAHRVREKQGVRLYFFYQPILSAPINSVTESISRCSKYPSIPSMIFTDT